MRAAARILVDELAQPFRQLTASLRKNFAGSHPTTPVRKLLDHTMTPRNDERDPSSEAAPTGTTLSPYDDDYDDDDGSSASSRPAATPLASAFASSTLSVVASSSSPSSSSSSSPAATTKARSSDVVAFSGGGAGGSSSYRTTSFYRDSSGRSALHLRLKLECDSIDELDRIVRSGCVSAPPSSPPPEESADDGGDDGGDEDASEEEEAKEDGDDPKASSGGEAGDNPPSSLRFEVRSLAPSGVTVEGISILSTSVGSTSALFEVEIVVRASASDDGGGGGRGGGGRFGAGGGPRPPPLPSPRQQSDGFSRLASRASSVSSYGGGGGAGLTSSTHSTVGSSFIEDIEEEDAQDEEEEERDGEEKRREEDEEGGAWGGDDFCGGDGAASTVKAQLEIRAVLSERQRKASSSSESGPDRDDDVDDRAAAADLPAGGGPEDDGLSLGLLALELGGGAALPSPLLTSPSNRTDRRGNADRRTTTSPVFLTLSLTEALSVSVKEIGGARAAAGATLVSLIVSHSNSHDEDVTVTNIALHPGHSRLWQPPPPSTTTQPPPPSSSAPDDRTVTTASSTAVASGVGLAGGRPPRPPGHIPAISNDAAAPAPPVSSFQTGRPPHAAFLPSGRSMPGGQHSVIDMSRAVRWGYAPGTAPDLPLVIKPHEAYATVIQIDAGEELRSRAFWSPVAVTALVGGDDDGDDDDNHEKAKTPTGGEGTSEGGKGDGTTAAAVRRKSLVVASTDARWTTARVAWEPADAFRVDMSLAESRCKVGAPLVVTLRVLNLSHESRDLMLLMAKDEEGRSSAPTSGGGGGGGLAHRGGRVVGRHHPHHRQHQQHPPPRHYRPPQQGAGRQSSPTQGGPNPPPTPSGGVNTAVVSEVNGYTFGVWGLSGDDDGTTRHNRDHELLAVDAALLLGEVKGQHTIEAELRFVPLREGTLDVPNLKLYDKTGGRWYNCVHMLKIVAGAAATAVAGS